MNSTIKRWGGVVVSGLLTAGGISAALENPTNWWIAIMFGACTAYYYFSPAGAMRTPSKKSASAVLVDAYSKKDRPSLGWPLASVGEKTIAITSYPYKFSSFFGKHTEIVASRISCVFSSSDAGIVIDGKEILFLPKEAKSDLDAFATRNSIPTPHIREVWSLLAEPFIDQPYETEEHDYLELEKLLCTRDETVAVRSNIRSVMLAATFFTMEWVEYTTQDVLRALLLLGAEECTPQVYLQLMELALRPYRLPIENA